MHKVNYHIHTAFSDGQLSIDKVIRELELANVESFAITDHDQILGAEYLKNNPTKIQNFPGVELTAYFDKEVYPYSLSPCNTVFCDNEPIVIIDWDSAALSERWEDLTYVLWLWINIGSHYREHIDVMTQIEKALDAYGADAETKKNFADKMLWYG